MSGLFGSKNKPVGSQPTVYTSLRVQSSCYGVAIPIIYGTSRSTPNLIWYGDFLPIAHTSSQSTGGKGGGNSTLTNTTYTYQTAVALGICEGTIGGIGTIWAGKNKHADTVIGAQDVNVGSSTGFYSNIIFRNSNPGEYWTIPSSPYQVTVSHASQFKNDLSVYYDNGSGDPAIQFTNVSPSAPSTNYQYSVSGGVYTFFSGDVGLSVYISYTYTIPSYTSTALAQLGLSLFSGSWPTQTAWGYLSSNHPGQDLGYQGLCYAAGATVDLGDSPNLPNYSFEVKGPLSGTNVGSSGSVDANPKEILNDFLTNTNYGSLFPSAQIGTLTNYSNYCIAMGLFLSPVIKEQKASAEFIKTLVEETNSEGFFSEGLLKVVPRGDQIVTGNGVTYDPTSWITPLYDLTDDDFLYESGNDPITLTRTAPSDAYNWVKVEYLDRSNDYNTSTVDAWDQANTELYARRPADTVSYHDICSQSVAKTVAQLRLQRALYIRNQYEFRLGAKYMLLEPMDVVTLTDANLGLSKAQVRILSIEEDENYELTVVVEEFPFGVAHAPVYTSQGGVGWNTNFNTPADTTNAPVIFMAPGVLTATGYEVWMAVSGAGANWGGCDIYVSPDQNTYKYAGTIHGAARYGTLTSGFALHTDPDTTDTLAVDLTVSKGSLTGGTRQDADNLTMLALVDSELVSFQSATLTAQYKYNIGTYIRRGVYNSPIAAHISGATFIRLDTAIFKYAFDPALVGTTLWFKFVSFNQYGGGQQNILNAIPYAFTLGSSISYPSNVANFVASQNGTNVVLQWDISPDPIPYIGGYEIRYNPQGTTGDTIWNNATYLTRVTRGTQVTTAKLPPGSWTLLICARGVDGNYSPTPTVYRITMTNPQTVLYKANQAPIWPGVAINFVRHWTGVLVPDDQKTASQYGWELFDNYVNTPFAICTYDSPEIDLGIDGSVRVHGEILSALGQGVTSGTANPALLIDWRLAAGSYQGFQPWTIGTVNARYVKERIQLTTAQGLAYISQFTPTIDNNLFSQSTTLTVSVGGTTWTYPTQFHNIGAAADVNVQATPIGTTGLVAVISNITNTGCKVQIFNSAGTDVGGTAKVIATGA